MPTKTVLDRKTMPALSKPGNTTILHAKQHKLPNGIPVYYIHAGTQDVVKLELVFRAGTLQQSMPLQAGTVNAMLEEGTQKHNAEEIASLLDYYGAFLETSVHQDYASVIVYSLEKHINNVLPIVEEIVKEPVFPQEEMDVYIKNKKQSFLVGSQKVRVVAERNFPSLFFGNAHPYGHVVSIEEFDALKKENLQLFHHTYYSPNDCAIIVSGHVNDTLLHTLGNYFGNATWKAVRAENNKTPEFAPNARKKHFIEQKDAVQAALRIGRPMFQKNHPDAIPFQILNIILGGYFGSRLMSNIREDKGYTYGIGSGVVFLSHAGYFQISSEVGEEVRDKALVEIYKEIDRLCSEPVPESELQLVKNYALGSFLRSIDGPFALAERFKSIWLHGMDYSYYENYLQTLADITASELREIAVKYLQKDSMYELVVGAGK